MKCGKFWSCPLPPPPLPILRIEYQGENMKTFVESQIYIAVYRYFRLFFITKIVYADIIYLCNIYTVYVYTNT